MRVSSAEELVGREAEFALAASAVRQLSEGRASVLIIEGEAGIGKTRLVQSIVDNARSRDVAVCYGQAHPFERTRPFGVVAAALDLSRRSGVGRGTWRAGPGRGCWLRCGRPVRGGQPASDGGALPRLRANVERPAVCGQAIRHALQSRAVRHSGGWESHPVVADREVQALP